MSEHGEHLAALVMTALAVIFAFAAVYGWSGVPQHPTASRVLKWIVFFAAAVWGIYSAIVIWRNKGTNPWTNLNWQDVVVIQAYALASWRWFAVIVIALFAFLIGRSTRTPSEPETKPQALPKPDLEESLADSLRGCQDEWLHDKLKADKTGIQGLVRFPGIVYIPDFQKAQIDFGFSVFNGSLCDIVIENSVSGEIRYGEDNDSFFYPPKFLSETPIECASRKGNYFVIRQAIRQEEIPRFQDVENVLISLHGLQINFQGTERFSEIGTTPLDTQHYLQTKKRLWRDWDRLDFIFGYTDEQWNEIRSGSVNNAAEIENLKAEVSSLKSATEPKALTAPEKPSLVFLRVDPLLVYYSEAYKKLMRFENKPRTAIWRQQHPTVWILAAYYRNQPDEARQPSAIRNVTAELTYDTADGPYVVPRGLWFPENKSAVDIGYNDAAGFVLAVCYKTEDIYCQDKNGPVRLGANELTVNVRLFSGTDGSIVEGGRFKIEIIENANGFDFRATKL